MPVEIDNEDVPIVFNLPRDTEWKELLEGQRIKYDEELAIEDRYQPPEVRNRTKPGYGRRIIDKLFENGSVNTSSLSQELLIEQGDSFNIDGFEEACDEMDLFTSELSALRQSLRE